MKIRLLAIGTKMPAWVRAGFEEYQKRLNQEFTLELVEIDAIKRTKSADLARIKTQEGDALLNAANSKHHLIALDVKGGSWSTEKLSQNMSAWQLDGRNVDLLIGGPEGLSEACLTKAKQHWSLSPLTLPHPLVRILVAEQLYRGWSMLNNHPYHR